MKRFLLFSGEDHEILGGVRDYDGTFETLVDAQEAKKHWVDWAHVAMIGRDGTITEVASWHRPGRSGGTGNWEQAVSDEEIEKLCGTWIDRSRVIQADGTPTEWYDKSFS